METYKFELLNLIKGGSSTSGCFKLLFNIANSAIQAHMEDQQYSNCNF